MHSTAFPVRGVGSLSHVLTLPLMSLIAGSIGCLTKLEELLLSSNQISAIPASLILLVKLKELHVRTFVPPAALFVLTSAI